MGDPTGYGFHGDFINGWTNQSALEAAMATCNEGTDGFSGESGQCSLVVEGYGVGEMGEMELDVPAAMEEDLGLGGTGLEALPGLNPVVGQWPYDATLIDLKVGEEAEMGPEPNRGKYTGASPSKKRRRIVGGSKRRT